MPRCPVCDGEEFDLQDGLYYCSECFTQSQEIREERLDEDYTEGIRNVRTVKSTREVKKSKDEGPRWNMVDAFNVIVRNQVDALISLGAGSDLKEATLHLWSRYLKQCEQAFVTTNEKWKPKFFAKPYIRDIQVRAGKDCMNGKIVNMGGYFVLKDYKYILEKEKKKAAQLVKEKEKIAAEGTAINKKKRGRKKMVEDGNSVAEDNSVIAEDNTVIVVEDDNIVMAEITELCTETPKSPPGKKKKKWKKATILNQKSVFSQYAKEAFMRRSKQRLIITGSNYPGEKITLMAALSIPCLALRIMKETILFSDISRWVKQGHIPYMQAYKVLPSDWKILPNEKNFFAPRCKPKMTSICLAVRRMAQFLGFNNSDVLDVRYVAARFIADMNLPYALMPFVDVVLEWFMPKRKGTLAWRIEVFAVVAILVVLKHLFALDGRTEKKLSEIAKRENLKFPETETEKHFFVWSEWEDQMEMVTAVIRSTNTNSLFFSPGECQDTNAVISHIQNSRHFNSESTISKGRHVSENLSTIHKAFAQITNERIGNKKEEKEPANSFAIRSIIHKCRQRTGKIPTDFSKRKIHSARSELYWLWHEGNSNLKKETLFPYSFLLVFQLVEEITDLLLQEVLCELEIVERVLFKIPTSKSR